MALAFNSGRCKYITNLTSCTPGQTPAGVLRSLKGLTVAVFLACWTLLAIHTYRGFSADRSSLGELMLVPFSLSLYTRGSLFLWRPFWPLAFLICIPLTYIMGFACLAIALLTRASINT